jgi:hypothetical protein
MDEQAPKRVSFREKANQTPYNSGVNEEPTPARLELSADEMRRLGYRGVDLFFFSFPNSVWERTCPRNSVASGKRGLA